MPTLIDFAAVVAVVVAVVVVFVVAADVAADVVPDVVVVLVFPQAERTIAARTSIVIPTSHLERFIICIFLSVKTLLEPNVRFCSNSICQTTSNYPIFPPALPQTKVFVSRVMSLNPQRSSPHKPFRPENNHDNEKNSEDEISFVCGKTKELGQKS